MVKEMRSDIRLKQRIAGILPSDGKIWSGNGSLVMDDRLMHQQNEVKEREMDGWEERCLTRGGGLGTEHVWVLRVGLQVRVGGVFLQQGHLALPDWWRRARGWVVGGRRGRREGWREQWGGRGWREGATWRMVGEKNERGEGEPLDKTDGSDWQWKRHLYWQTFILPVYWNWMRNFCCERLTMSWMFVTGKVLCIWTRKVQPQFLEDLSPPENQAFTKKSGIFGKRVVWIMALRKLDLDTPEKYSEYCLYFTLADKYWSIDHF